MLEEWADAAEPFTTAQDDMEPYADDVPAADDTDPHDIAPDADPAPGVEEGTVR